MIRVALNGIHCIQQTWDDAMNYDGFADEICLTWSTSTAKAGGAVPHVGVSGIFGDTNRQPGRIRAGSATDSGGIKSDNIVPFRLGRPPFWPSILPPPPPWPQPAWSSQVADGFPMTLWEGELIGDAAVAIVPLVNEVDYGTANPEPALRLASKLTTEVGKLTASIAPPIGAVVALVGAVIDGLAAAIGAAGTRPIGRRLQDNDDISQTQWMALSLNSGNAASAAAQDNGYGPGIFRFVQTDPADIGSGSYAMYLQVSVVR
jgi:hypothetical protein